MCAGLLFGLVGCGDDSGIGGSGGSGTGGSGGSGTGGSGGTGTMVMVSGIVVAASIDGPEAPAEGVTVRVVGTSNSAMTDAQGAFSVMAPSGSATFVTAADGNWGEQSTWNVPPAGRTDLGLAVIPDALVDAVAASLGKTADLSKGIVSVSFDEDMAVGGETASISASSEFSFVFDATDAPVLGDTLIAGPGTEVNFVNTDVTSDVSATATNAADQSCTLEFPDVTYSVQAKVLTEIDVTCP